MPKIGLGEYHKPGDGSSFAWDARLIFCEAVQEVAPEILATLRDQVLTGRKDIVTRAKEFNPNEPWLLAQARSTLEAWRVAPELADDPPDRGIGPVFCQWPPSRMRTALN